MSMMLAVAAALAKKKMTGWLYRTGASPSLFNSETLENFSGSVAISGYTARQSIGDGNGGVYVLYSKDSTGGIKIVAKWVVEDGAFVLKGQTPEFKNTGTVYTNIGYYDMLMLPDVGKLVVILNPKVRSYSGDDMYGIFAFTIDTETLGTPTLIWSYTHSSGNNDDRTGLVCSLPGNAFAISHSTFTGSGIDRYIRALDMSGAYKVSYTGSVIKGLCGCLGDPSALYSFSSNVTNTSIIHQIRKYYFGGGYADIATFTQSGDHRVEFDAATPHKDGFVLLGHYYDSSSSLLYVYDAAGALLASRVITYNQLDLIGTDESGNAVLMSSSNTLYKLVVQDGSITYELYDPSIVLPNAYYQWGIGLESAAAYTSWPNG